MKNGVSGVYFNYLKQPSFVNSLIHLLRLPLQYSCWGLAKQTSRSPWQTKKPSDLWRHCWIIIESLKIAVISEPNSDDQWRLGRMFHNYCWLRRRSNLGPSQKYGWQKLGLLKMHWVNKDVESSYNPKQIVYNETSQPGTVCELSSFENPSGLFLDFLYLYRITRSMGKFSLLRVWRIF